MTSTIDSFSLETPLRDFAAVGVTELEESAYRLLLRRPSLDRTEIREVLGSPADNVRDALDSLVVKGLVVVSLTTPSQYAPVRPDVALDILVQQRADQLLRARSAAARLLEQMGHEFPPSDSSERVLEILDDRDQALNAIGRIQRMATRECLCLDKPPYISGPPSTVDSDEMAGLSRGVAYRTLIDAEAFNFPGVLERVRTSIDAGAVVRIASKLPQKLLVVDGRIGLIPMSMQELTGPVLLLRTSSLLDALCAFFELLWQQATPVTFSRAGELKTCDGTSRMPLDVDQLIPRLAAGINDKTIAHDLGLSPRTFDRRIDEFMKNLNARTRFQAGWLAAHKLAALPDR